MWVSQPDEGNKGGGGGKLTKEMMSWDQGRAGKFAGGENSGGRLWEVC